MTNCTSGESFHEPERNLFVLCAWNEKKEEIEEGIRAIAHVRGEIEQLILSHGICQAHKEEFLLSAKQMKHE